MKYMFIIAFTIMLAIVLVAGWVRDAQASNSYTQDLEARVAALEEELAFQSGNIEELELLQWNDPERVGAVVRHKLWERATSCYVPLCYRLDPILYAFYNIPHNERGNYIGQLITSSSWTAENQGDGTWLVTATHQDGNSYTFEANSIYQIICSEHTPVCR